MTNLYYQAAAVLMVGLAATLLYLACKKQVFSVTVRQLYISVGICCIVGATDYLNSFTISLGKLADLGVIFAFVLLSFFTANRARAAFAEDELPSESKFPGFGIALSVLRDQAPGQVRLMNSNEVVWSRPANRRGVIAEGQMVQVTGLEGACYWVRPVNPGRKDLSA